MGLVVTASFAFEAVNSAAVWAADGAVGLNWQKHFRMVVPQGHIGCWAVQRQIMRGDGDDFFVIAHKGVSCLSFIFCTQLGGIVVTRQP